MSIERESFFRVIHKALRSELGRLAGQAGRTDFADAAEVARLRASAEETFALLEEHAANEDRFLMPLLRRCAPQIASRLDRAHAGQHDTLDGLRARLAAAASAGAAAAREGHAFLLQLSRVQAEQLSHMADEEELAQPALWRAYDDETLRGAHAELLASIAPAHLAHMAALMLPAMNAPERAQMLSGARATMPGPAFEGLLEVAESALDPADFSRLRRDLAVPRAA